MLPASSLVGGRRTYARFIKNNLTEAQQQQPLHTYVCFSASPGATASVTLESPPPTPLPAPPTLVTPPQVFASFRFDENACLTPRRGPDDKPSIGWEVHVADPFALRKQRVHDKRTAEPSKVGLRYQCDHDSIAARGVGVGCACCCGRVGVDDVGEGRDLQETRVEEGRMKVFSQKRLLPVLSQSARRTKNDGVRGGAAGELGAESDSGGGGIYSVGIDDMSVAMAVDGSCGAVSCGEREDRFHAAVTFEPEVDCVGGVKSSQHRAPFALDGDNSTRPLQFHQLQTSVSSMIDKINGVTGPRGGEEKMAPDTGNGGDIVSKIYRPRAASRRWSSPRSDVAELGVTGGSHDNCDHGDDEQRPRYGEKRGHDRYDCSINNGIGRDGGGAVDVVFNEYSDRVEFELARPADNRSSGREMLADTTATPRARFRDRELVRVGELPDVCAICLGQYKAEEQVYVLPCLHIFHAEVWLTGGGYKQI